MTRCVCGVKMMRKVDSKTTNVFYRGEYIAESLVDNMCLA